MRKIINIQSQMKIGFCDIGDIKFNPRCRDEITQLLIGLQQLYVNPETRKQIIDVLKEVPQKDVNNGRPGMDLWQILVLAVLRVNCNFDWDKIRNLADNHNEIRQMLGLESWLDETKFSLQCIKDNVSLLEVETINKINLIAVKAGQKLVKKKKKKSCMDVVIPLL